MIKHISSFESKVHFKILTTNNVGRFKSPNLGVRKTAVFLQPCKNGFWSWTTDAQFNSKDQSVIKDDDHDVPIERLENDPRKTFEQKLRTEQYFLKRLHRKIFSRVQSRV